MTPIPKVEDNACKFLLYLEMPGTKIRLWDFIILIPNLAFMIFLIFKFNQARLKLRATNSPIYITFYSLVIANVIVSIIRCVISMFMNASSSIGSNIDIILWVIVRFFLLSSEMSYILFSIAFGHLDSRTSLHRVLAVTMMISFLYSVSQGALELLAHDEHFHVPSRDIFLFGHGGIIFWFVSSTLFSTLYALILILPLTKLRERLALPVKRSFYTYVAMLLALNTSCSVGGAMLLADIKVGLCVVDVTTCVYFTFFTPLVYYMFLSSIFHPPKNTLAFSYANHMDELGDEDGVSIPRRQSFSSLKTDSDYVYQTTGTYSNPQFGQDLQSPDSVAGYSINSDILESPVTFS